MKLLLLGTYHSTHPEYGLNDDEYFEQIGLALDVYCSYENFLLVGDFNVEEEESCLKEFLFQYNAKNLVKEKTCFKSIDSPSCIDLFLTNSYRNFQNTTAIATGLSDFHKMVVTVLKNTFPKAEPKVIQYRDYKNFVIVNFREELRSRLQSETIENYTRFEEIFIEILDKFAPLKKKFLRANDKPYMTKILRKAIMRRSALQNRFFRDKLPETERAFKKQRNYTKKLLRKEKTKYFSGLNLKNYTDNKKFWNTVKPLLSNVDGGPKKITLILEDKVISNDEEVAESINQFFSESVKTLNITENSNLINGMGNIFEPVYIALKKFECHPSIIEIKENVAVDSKFLFSKVAILDIELEIQNLDIKKAGTFSNISAKRLKEVENVIVKPLTDIWNKEIIENKKFPCKLKLADITPLFKKLDCSVMENYRPVSILPVVSKIFERIMQKQMNMYVEKYLSPLLCGYRKGYNTQYALIAMIEKWKKTLDQNSGLCGAILMDLSKAFDTINHELLIAKLEAYGFDNSALIILLNYLSKRSHRTKINASFSSWAEISSGVPQGSILGPLLFNLYINDLFFQFINTHPCNFADDTTLSAFGTNVEDILYNLEYDVKSAIIWFENNYMKLNHAKCHFLVLGKMNEHLWAKVGDEQIWESYEEKLLGVIIDKNLNFNSHLTTLCNKVGQKVTVLARLAKLLPFHKRRLILKTFIESQFSYCALAWMFHSRKINRKINHIHERALRLVYDDYMSTFEELLITDKSILIHHRNIHKVAIEMYKVKNNLSPPFMKDIFCHMSGGRKTRMGDKFARPNVNKVFKGQQSLRNFGPIIWNSMLPEKLKLCSSLAEFKTTIKSWTPNNCPCRLCEKYIEGLGFVKTFE